MRGARLGLLLLSGYLLVGLGADLIASERPLACYSEGGLHLLPAPARPPSAVTWCLPTPIPYGPNQQHPGGVTLVRSPPSWRHWLGTDDRGRDVAARLVHGARVALLVGPLAVGLALLAGLGLGAATLFGPRVDFLIGRITDVGLTFPTLLLLLAIQGLWGHTSVIEVALAIAFTQWPHLCRLTRGEVLRLTAAPHVEAARALGGGPWRVALVHVLPLAATPALTAAAFGMGQAVLFETALTFLGLGVPPPTASWGELLAQAQASGLDWWLLMPPTVAIALLVLACQLVGDGLRAALDPRAAAPEA